MKKYAAEFLGTFFLLNAIVGSGIMATNLTTNAGIQLIINAISAVAALAVIIPVFAKKSGSHFNPAVSLYFFIKKELSGADFSAYVLAQIMGAITGTLVANKMFGLTFVEISTHNRISSGTFIGEVLATLGLLIVISAKPEKAQHLVPTWIGSAYFFTASTSFANPAVTIGRIFTNTFGGIAPSSILGFIGAQLLAVLLVLLLKPVIAEDK